MRNRGIRIAAAAIVSCSAVAARAEEEDAFVARLEAFLAGPAGGSL
ncbi:MAG TPA: hypothetical protein VLA66_11285 [Thermoanaerobaculia bacterium]|nr:hypothetical protein [Thermoanaerobaculia bacterium]